jgi:hypothetical protein
MGDVNFDGTGVFTINRENGEIPPDLGARRHGGGRRATTARWSPSLPAGWHRL